MSNIQLVQNQIELARPEFESNVEALKLNLNFQKEASFALQMFQGNDFMMKMDANSIKNAIVNVALTGLTLNPVMKFAYLIPRKGKCVLDVSYMGLSKILTDTGSVKNIEASIVYWGEPFKMIRGTSPSIEHGIIEDPNIKKGNIRGAYSIAVLNDGSKSIEWMDADELMSIMQRSEAVKKGKMSPWQTDPGEMCRKSVIKRHYKYLPKSERTILAATAIGIDHENNGIDFEAEQNKKTTTVSIDTIEPNEENNNKFGEMLNFLVSDRGKVQVQPQVIGGISHQEFADKFWNELMSGNMPKEKAENIYNRILECAQ